ncbi:MAG: tRNA (adenosine(37)-N6)-threonylcarbamoyltransferase complex transferase subunit TsaD [Bacteroidales bacterium]|nr:tRNA (adenosine(37)-N6)-threonylcarbamoyltransferase complex transferase subunit TsaD [Bacteroidales bacterium]
MKILAIDTSCDETACAVTEGINVLSNIIWSQASAHAKFGGVMPSLAQRMHEEHIDWVVKKSLNTAGLEMRQIDAVAVTNGPGLSIALGVGVNKAKELAILYKKPIIAINHVEAHLLSSIVNNKNVLDGLEFPALGLVVSGGNTILVEIRKIGKYKILVQTTDDALGEALDKTARMLGLGYPGGAILEKMAKLSTNNKYVLPIPIVGHEDRKIFTYSGIKTSVSRLIASENPLDKEKIYNIAEAFQQAAFTHLIRMCKYIIENSNDNYKNLLVGGGVSANIELRKRLRNLGKNYGITVSFPKSKKVSGDNAAMIGATASFKFVNKEFENPDTIDRNPNLKLSND